MHRSGLGKTVAELLPALLCIGSGVVASVPHPAPFASTATVVLAVLGAGYWLTTGLMQGRDQHSAWYKPSRILVGLAYLLALPECWRFATAPAHAPTLMSIGEIGLLLLILLLGVAASYASRESALGSHERRRERFFSRKTPPFNEHHTCGQEVNVMTGWRHVLILL